MTGRPGGTGPRIERVETHLLSLPLHTPFVTALRRTTTIETVLVRLTDTDGCIGWGEAPQVWQVTGDSLAGSRACLDGPMADVLVAAPADPSETAPLIQRAVVGNRSAKMAADVALHDLAARRAGVPLAVHLAQQAGRPDGAGTATSVRTDVTLAAGDASGLAEAARARVSDGFTTLKLKVGTDAATDVARVRAVRDAVGPGIGLRLDANQGWDAFTAIEVIHALEDAGVGVEVVEQPVPAHDVLGLAHVTAHVDTPIMADESLFTLEDLVEIIRCDAADLVNVKLAKCGGLTPALELLGVAQRHGFGTFVGSMMESHVGIGAAASLVAAVGVTSLPDLDAAWWATSSPYDGGVAYERDEIVLPTTPGLGINGFEGEAR
ncbi:dipeptide epimerase [Nocardioides sp.]|uniref:mandelate racemase/muconate lactonizing enzyme family protein n=1 Tax=Nocardioides sp. TaxID=35761 RepID=UPI002B2653CB|nr:dipeptide epimerase [Nocardioides sp.]